MNQTGFAPLPMFHMAAILPLICCMDAGAAFLSMLHLEPELSLKMMEKEKVTCFSFVPYHYHGDDQSSVFFKGRPFEFEANKQRCAA